MTERILAGRYRLTEQIGMGGMASAAFSAKRKLPAK